jgi:flagellar biosynthesis protein FliP
MLRILLVVALMLLGPFAMAQEPSGILAQGNNPLSIPAITLTTDAQGQQEYSVSLQILLIMTALSFIPAFVMVVASVLMAMGMMMLSPLIISLPFKIMLFVLVDGWGLIIGTLAGSFGTL